MMPTERRSVADTGVRHSAADSPSTKAAKPARGPPKTGKVDPLHGPSECASGRADCICLPAPVAGRHFPCNPHAAGVDRETWAAGAAAASALDALSQRDGGSARLAPRPEPVSARINSASRTALSVLFSLHRKD